MLISLHVDDDFKDMISLVNPPIFLPNLSQCNLFNTKLFLYYFDILFHREKEKVFSSLQLFFLDKLFVCSQSL